MRAPARQFAFLILTPLMPALWAVPNAAMPSVEKNDPAVAGSKAPGVVLDDQAAELTGSWVTSNKLPPLVGATYRHDDDTDRGRKRARFTPEIPAAGEYEVRLLYTADDNRSSRVAVTVSSADGEKTVTVNEREPALVDAGSGDGPREGSRRTRNPAIRRAGATRHGVTARGG